MDATLSNALASRSTRVWIIALSSLAFGLALPLSMAPFNLWPLAWLSLAGFFWIGHRAETGRQAFWFGWLYGAGLFGLGISWVFGSMRTVATPIPLSLLLTGLFCGALAFLPAIQAWLYHRFLKPAPWALSLGAPLLWVVFEWIRSWLFTGLPWLLSGYALTDLPLGQWAAVISVYGLGAVIAFSAAQLARGPVHGLRRSVPGLFSAIGTVVAATIIGINLPATHWSTPSTSIQAAAVQSNIGQAEKWLSSNIRPTLDFYGQQAKTLSEPDLVIWPEAALTVRPHRIPTYLDELDTLARERDQGVITGIITTEDDRYFNALLGFGNAEGEYRKQHLVPFGEYLPFDRYLRGLIAFFNIPMSTLSPAPTAQTPMPWTFQGETRDLAPVICYEAAYPGLVRELADSSDLLVMVSNDAWFGDSLAPHQHLQITRMRAIENSRAIVRATQNGISALIDANGQILDRSRQFEVAVIRGEVELRSGLTPYQRWGSGWWILLPLAGLGALYWLGRKPRL